MFDQLKNLKELASMLGNTSELREKAEQMRSELANKTVSADAGAGAVRATVNGRMEVVRIELDQPMLQTLAGAGDEMDRQMVEELIAAAVNEALQRAQQLVQEELSKLTGGMNLPGMDQLLGGQ